MWTSHLPCGLQCFVAIQCGSVTLFLADLAVCLICLLWLYSCFLSSFLSTLKETVLTVPPYVKWRPCDLDSHRHNYHPPFRVKDSQYNLAVFIGCPGGSDHKESACNAGDLGSVPGLRRSPGEGNDNPLQYSCLANPMNRGAWRSMELQSRTQPSDWHFTVLLLSPFVVIYYRFNRK